MEEVFLFSELILIINNNTVFTHLLKVLSIQALVAKLEPDKVVRWCQDGNFGDFLRPVFSASRMQYISELHSKFALRAHHVW